MHTQKASSNGIHSFHGVMGPEIHVLPVAKP